ATTVYYTCYLHDALPIYYSLKVRLLERLAGYEHEKVELGDTCIAIDRKFSRPIELVARVIAIGYDVFNPEDTAMVEMGQFLSVRSEEHTSELQSRENIVC